MAFTEVTGPELAQMEAEEAAKRQKDMDRIALKAEMATKQQKIKE